MAVTDQTDTMWANNKRTLKFTVTDADNGGALNLTSLDVKFAMSPIDAGEFSTDPVIEKTESDGITITDAANGLCEVQLDAADTADISGDYYFELEVFDGTPEGVVVATGTITINRNVVNA